MSHQQVFESMYESFFSILTLDTFIEFDSNFGADKLLSDMFMYLWNLNIVHDHININLFHASKDEKKADNYRKEGNIYYKNKDLFKALECYNKCIIHSSHLENLSKNLALGYANRSAVLYEIKNYNACINDINNSLNHGYPSVLKAKLIERQAKCYIALNNRLKADEVLNKFIEEVNNTDTNSKNIHEKSMTKLKDLLAACGFDHDSFSNSNYAKHEYEKKLFEIEVPNVPQLLDQNLAMPTLSNAVTLEYSKEKGRHMIAHRDIVPGEVLVIEKSFVSAAFPSSLFSHCSFCLKRTCVPVPCPGCSHVVFCSEDCATNAKSQFHNMECSLLPTLVTLDLGKNSFLALRLILRETLTGLHKKIPVYEREEVEISNNEIGFNNLNIFDPYEFRAVYQLVTNLEKCSVNVLLKRGLQAVCMVKLLLKSDFFRKDNNSTMSQNLQDIGMVGKSIFRLLLNLPLNTHSITEECINLKNPKQSNPEEIGAGVFSTFSRVNHSCNPNVCRSFYGTLVVARAILFIPKGAEITDSYGYHYAMDNIDKRQTQLQERYYFCCRCEPCLYDWPQSSMLTDDIYLKCGHCNSKINSSVKECPKCKINIFNTFYNGMNYEQVFSNVQKVIKNIKLLLVKILEGDQCESYEQEFLDAIYVISSQAILPMKTLNEIQERLKYCFDRKGSRYFRYFSKIVK